MQSESESSQESIVESTLSSSTKSGSEKSCSSFSKADTNVVERILGLKIESLKRNFELRIEKLIDLLDVPDRLLEDAYKNLRDNLRTLEFPSDDVNKETKSVIIRSLLQAVNLYFLDKFNVQKDELLIEQELPVIWFKYHGKINLAVIRSTDKFDAGRGYFFVVECSMGDPLDRLKQCIMCLKRVQQLNPNEKVRIELRFSRSN